MKKKVAAIFMASIMAFSLAACGSNGGSSDSGKTDSGDKSTAASTADTGSGEVEKIIVSFPTWTGAPADTEKVQEAINDITRDKIGVEVELSIILVPSTRTPHWHFLRMRRLMFWHA